MLKVRGRRRRRRWKLRGRLSREGGYGGRRGECRGGLFAIP